MLFSAEPDPSPDPPGKLSTSSLSPSPPSKGIAPWIANVELMLLVWYFGAGVVSGGKVERRLRMEGLGLAAMDA